MRKYLAVAALAVAGLLAACGEGQPLGTAQGKAVALGASYAFAKAGFAAYAASSVADPAVVAAVNKALPVADLAVARAQANLLASTTTDGQGMAYRAGMDAIAVFTQALATYGVPPAPAAKPGD